MYNIPFTKMHGLGNDYIYINCIDNSINDPHSLAVEMSDRHKRIGADRINLITRSEVADFRTKMYNSDGSERDMCGNACRCIAHYVYDKKLTKKTHFSIETNAGIKHAEVILHNTTVTGITIDTGTASFSPDKIPADSESEIIDRPLKISSSIYNITVLSVGNPHCILFVDDLENIDIKFIGSEIENHPLFPKKANIEFVKLDANINIRARVWERGSGVCAIAVAVNKLFHAPNRQTIHMPNGDLEIYINPKNNHIYMTGEAEFVYEGMYKTKQLVYQ